MSKIRVGGTLPDFELPDETGALHRLSQHQRELLKFHEWSSVAFTQLVTVLPNDLHDVSKLKLSTGAHWTFLADRELEVQTALDIREYTDPHHDATVPHALVLGPGLEVDEVYVGYWFWGRPTPYQLWEDVGDLLRRIKPDFDPTTPKAKAAWEGRAGRGAGVRRGGPPLAGE